MRTMTYCGVASVAGRSVADLLWDRLAPPGLDMDMIADQEAMSVRAEERSKQDAVCDLCQELTDCDR